MHLLKLPKALLFLPCVISTLVRADVEFTAPAAGSKVPVGTIDVRWKESGIAPPLDDLTVYTLVLMVGGNQDGQMATLATFEAGGQFSAGSRSQGTIPSGIAGSINNGFFFKMIATSSKGATIINYSDRFSITGLTGVTLNPYRKAAEALDGSTAGPSNVGDAASSSTSATTKATSTVAKHRTSNSATYVTVTAKPNASSATFAHVQSDPGLSKGALAGIAIACAAVGVIGITIGLCVWVRARRRKQQEQRSMESDSTQHLPTVARKEMTVTIPVELDPYAKIVEADKGAPPKELDSAQIRAELEGDFVHDDSWTEPLTSIPSSPISVMTLQYPTSLEPGTPVTPRDNL